MNKIDHPVLNELMVRNLYVDNKQRTYLATDSGLYRYSNKQLIKIDDKFNGTDTAYNGPIGGVMPFDDRFLIVSTFPHRQIIFDTIEDKYVSHPLTTLFERYVYRVLYYDSTLKRGIVGVIKNNGLYSIDAETLTTNFVFQTKEHSRVSTHRNSHDSPIYIFEIDDLEGQGLSGSEAQRYKIYIHIKTPEGDKSLHTFYSANTQQQRFFLGTYFVVVNQNNIHVFDDKKLLWSYQIPTLCEVPSSAYTRTDGYSIYQTYLPKGSSDIVLFSPCGMHEFNINTKIIETLYLAPQENVGKWFLKSQKTLGGVINIFTKSAIYILDKERFEKIEALPSSSLGGTVYSTAKIDDHQYLIADGNPGLYLASDMISHFHSITEKDLDRLTGGNSLRHSIKDKHNNLWLSSQTNGLVLANFVNNRWLKRAHFLRGVHIRSLFDYQGELWIATEGAGLWLLNKSTLQLERLSALTGYHGALKFLQRKQIKTTKGQTNENHKQLLLSTTHGILLYDIETKTLLKEIPNVRGSIWAMAYDSTGNLWIGSHDTGLHKLNNDLEIIETYSKESLFGSVILDLVIDDNDEPVLATWGAGILYRKTGQLEFSQVNSSHGLLNDTIQSILRAGDGKYWISSDLGLARIDLCQDKGCEHDVTAYTRTDGLPTNLFDLNSAHKNADGTLMFGGFFGLVWFDPITDIQQNTYLPSAHNIDSMWVDGKIRTRDLSTSKQGQTIQLPYGVNAIRLRFTSNDYIAEPNKQFRYRINNSGWIITDTPEITISAPNFGKYKIESSSSNSSGMWSSHILHTLIDIAPPFWFSKLAFLLYAFLLMALAFAFYRLKSQRLRLLNESLQQRVTLKTKELAQKNIQLQLAIEHQEQMFENASHDLKTPISIISSCHALIKKGSLPVPLEHHLKLAIKHSDRLKVIIKRALLRERTRLSGDAKISNIAQLLLPEIDDREQVSAEKKVQIIHNVLSESECYAAISPSALMSIFGNILDNAIKYSPPNFAKVTIELSKTTKHILISISDEGPGLKDIGSYGKRYYRENDTIPGNGIGVSSAKELARRFDGVISVRNRISGGLEVTIALPLSQTSPESANEVALQASLNQIDALNLTEQLSLSQDIPRVLYIEDEMDMLDTFTAHCENAIKLVHASDGLHAKTALEGASLSLLPDVIVSDVMMPNMDGYEFCAWLKNNEDFKHIPLILLTAKSDIPSQAKGLASGADDYIDKLMPSMHIIKKINNIFNTIQAKEHRLTRYLSPSQEDIELSNSDLINPFIKVVKEEFSKHLANSDYAFKDLCKVVHKSESTVARNLHKNFGKTFSDLLYETRMLEAEKLLRGHLQIGKIAELCGFENFSYFSKRFKAKYAMSPSAYRKLKHQDEN